MTLQRLSEALQGQFVWDRRKHPYYVNESRNGNRNLALIIFVGLSAEYHIGEGRVIDYLEITDMQYGLFLMQYKKMNKRAGEVLGAGKKIDIHRPYGRMFIKRGLVKNCLTFPYQPERNTL